MHAKTKPAEVLAPVEARDLAPRRIGAIVSFDDATSHVIGEFRQLSAVGDGGDEVVLNVVRSGPNIPGGEYRERVGYSDEDFWMTEHVLNGGAIITFEPAGTVT